MRPQDFVLGLVKNWNSFWFWAFWFLFGVILFLAIKARIALALGYAPDLGGFERNVIWAVSRMLDGQPLYQDPYSGQHAIIQYQPVYYYWLATLAGWFQVAPSDALSLYRIARIGNVILGLGTSLVFYLTLRKGFQLKAPLSFFASLVPLLVLDSFAISGRSDTLKAFFFSALVFLATALPALRLRWTIFWNVLLASLAFFTKQDGLLFGLAMPFVWFWLGRWKAFLVQTFALAAILVAGTLALHSATHGAYLDNVLGGLKNGISLNWFAQVFYGFFNGRAILYIPALFLSIEFLREKDRRLVFLSFLLLLSFLGNVLLAFKYGSGTNYFTESTFLASALLAIGLHSARLPSFLVASGKAWAWGFLFLSVFFLSSLLPWAMTAFGNQEVVQRKQYEDQKELVKQIRNLFPLKKEMGLVLFNRQWEDYTTTLLGDKVLFPTRDVWTQVYEASDGVGFESVARFLNTGSQVSFLITEGDKIPVFLDLDASRFTIKERSGPYAIWVPK